MSIGAQRRECLLLGECEGEELGRGQSPSKECELYFKGTEKPSVKVVT